MTVNRIADGVVVSLAYKLTVDGEVIDEATNADPLEYLHGADMIFLAWKPCWQANKAARSCM